MFSPQTSNKWIIVSATALNMLFGIFWMFCSSYILWMSFSSLWRLERLYFGGETNYSLQSLQSSILSLNCCSAPWGGLVSRYIQRISHHKKRSFLKICLYYFIQVKRLGQRPRSEPDLIHFLNNNLCPLFWHTWFSEMESDITNPTDSSSPWGLRCFTPPQHLSPTLTPWHIVGWPVRYHGNRLRLRDGQSCGQISPYRSGRVTP